MENSWLLYGAYGFTGELIAREATARGMKPVLAGRRKEPLSRLADELGLQYRAFDLGDPDAVSNGLEGMTLVLHSAGPYSATSAPMVDACLQTHTHYLDITGEIQVFEALHARGPEAERADVVLLPGVGFDVVPTDCLGARLAGSIDDPHQLELAFRSTPSLTKGTAKSVVESLGFPNLVRRSGRIVEVPLGRLARSIPFSDKERFAMAIPWGDVSTAFHSTGIPDVTVYRTMHPKRVKKARMMRWGQWWLRLGFVQRQMKRRIDRTVHGPTSEQLSEGKAQVWGEVKNAKGETVQAELVTPNPYALTADAAVTSVARVLEGKLNRSSGFLTPSLAFGAGFVDELKGVSWTVEPALK
jgi:short subunit dehydrogenase-like uncharacterized protein